MKKSFNWEEVYGETQDAMASGGHSRNSWYLTRILRYYVTILINLFHVTAHIENICLAHWDKKEDSLGPGSAQLPQRPRAPTSQHSWDPFAVPGVGVGSGTAICKSIYRSGGE